MPPLPLAMDGPASASPPRTVLVFTKAGPLGQLGKSLDRSRTLEPADISARRWKRLVGGAVALRAHTDSRREGGPGVGTDKTGHIIFIRTGPFLGESAPNIVALSQLTSRVRHMGSL